MTTPDRKQPADLLIEIEKLVGKGFKAGQIYADLEARPAFKGRMPTLRTVQRIFRDSEPKDDSEDWRLDTAPLHEIPYVIEALALVMERYEGRRKSITVAEAALLVPIRSAAPLMPAWIAWQLVRHYQLRRERKADATDLDYYVATASRWSPSLSMEQRSAIWTGYRATHALLWPDRMVPNFSAKTVEEMEFALAIAVGRAS